MAETPEFHRETEALRDASAGMNTAEIKAWFVREVLPLETALMQSLHHNLGRRGDAADLRQEVYVRVCEAARKQPPDPVRPFVFTIARNLLIDRFRRERIIPIEGVADLAEIEVASDAPAPDRSVIARDEVRRLEAALEKLPPRCRQAVILRRVEGLNRAEIALRMGISKETVGAHLRDGARLLIDLLHDQDAS